MTFTFYKGEHRARPIYWLRWFPFLFFRNVIIRGITFTQESKYDLDDVDDHDQADINKGFGIASLSGVHKNSIRIGWNYNLELGVFVLYWYRYLNGVRTHDKLTVASTGRELYCQIAKKPGNFNIRVWDPFNSEYDICNIDIERGKISGVSLLLGPYFGGDKTPVSRVVIQLRKIRKRFIKSSKNTIVKREVT